jgi:hypothetical protein
MSQAAHRASPTRDQKSKRAQTGTTIRVREHVHASLQSLSTEMGESIQDIVEEAVEAFRRQRMLDQHNQAYAALKADPKRWQEELAERSGWNRANADRLEEA